MLSTVNLTSFAVNGVPSCQTTPCLNFIKYVVPSCFAISVANLYSFL